MDEEGEGVKAQRPRRSWFGQPKRSFTFDVPVDRSESCSDLTLPKENIEILELTHFTRPPLVDFGTVKIGQEKTCYLIVRNPLKYVQEVKVEKFPTKKKFSIDLLEFAVDAGDDLQLSLTWRPEEVGGCREIAQLHVDHALRLQFFVLGHAVENAKPKRRQTSGGGVSPHKKRQSVPAPVRTTRAFVRRKTEDSHVHHHYESKENHMEKLGPKLIKQSSRKSSGRQQMSGRVEVKENFNSDVRADANVLKETNYETTARMSSVDEDGGCILSFGDTTTTGKATPLRRETFVKCRPTIQTTPIKESSTFATSKSVSPPTVAKETLWQERTLDDLSLNCLSDTPSNLLRSDTYTLLTSGNNSPLRPIHGLKQPLIEEGVSETCRPDVQTSPGSRAETRKPLLRNCANLSEIVEEKLFEPRVQYSGVPIEEYEPSPPETCYQTATNTPNVTLLDSDPEDAFQDSVACQSHSITDGLSEGIVPCQNVRCFWNKQCKETSRLERVQESLVMETRVSNGLFEEDVLVEVEEEQRVKVIRECFGLNSQYRFNAPLRFNTEAVKSVDTVQESLLLETEVSIEDGREVLLSDGNIISDDGNESRLVEYRSVEMVDVLPRTHSDKILASRVQHELNEHEPVTDVQSSNLNAPTGKEDVGYSCESSDIRFLRPEQVYVLKAQSCSASIGCNLLSSTPLTLQRPSSGGDLTSYAGPIQTGTLSPILMNLALKGGNRAGQARVEDEICRVDNPFSGFGVTVTKNKPDFRDPAEEKLSQGSSSHACRGLFTYPPLCSQGKVKVQHVNDAGIDRHSDERLPGIATLQLEASCDKTASHLHLPEGSLDLPLPVVGDFKVASDVDVSGIGVSINPVISQNAFGLGNYAGSVQSRRTTADQGRSKRQHLEGDTSPTKKKVFRDLDQQTQKTSGNKDTVMKNSHQVKEMRKSNISTLSQSRYSKPADKSYMKPGLGVAHSKLLLLKPKKQSVITKHPMPFASKNMYYDERWMDKEESGFVKWLNFVLSPPDYYFEAKKQKVDAGILNLDSHAREKDKILLAPTKEDASLHAYSVRRQLNRLRKAACILFQSESMVKIVAKLEREIEAGRLSIRPDRKLHADVGLKQQVLDLILSYNPLWLRIGLETIYGEMLSLHGNDDVIGLSRFLLTRLLSNPDIASQYAHPNVQHLYREGYQTALAHFTLKKFFLLVLFLDKAKRSRLIDYDPCLFCKDSEYKSSRDLLVVFSRECLRGEGDVTKHLGYLGYTVSHVQSALDEFDYAVTNLAVDLRDGLRLTRLVELLTLKWTLSSELRVPAISRLQKIHNVSVVFKEIMSRGIDLQSVKEKSIDPRDIVDGHREKTLRLLWKIIFAFQVQLAISEQDLKSEVQLLQRRASEMKIMQKDELNVLGNVMGRRQSLEDDTYVNSPRLLLLLSWCRLICAQYGMKVENFTVSFSDGRALCYLVHHYHPSVLPLSSIRTETTLTYKGCLGLSGGNESVSDDSLEGESSGMLYAGDAKDFEKLFSNEQHNFRILHEKVSEIGGVPVMLKVSDMSNTIPDEKLVITYVSYLCARLLEIRHEVNAAKLIQAAWRKYVVRKKKCLIRVAAASCIQSVFRMFVVRRWYLERKRTVISIQRWYRRRKMGHTVVETSSKEMNLKSAEITSGAVLCEKERGEIEDFYYENPLSIRSGISDIKMNESERAGSGFTKCDSDVVMRSDAQMEACCLSLHVHEIIYALDLEDDVHESRNLEVEIVELKKDVLVAGQFPTGAQEDILVSRSCFNEARRLSNSTADSLADGGSAVSLSSGKLDCVSETLVLPPNEMKLSLQVDNVKYSLQRKNCKAGTRLKCNVELFLRENCQSELPESQTNSFQVVMDSAQEDQQENRFIKGKNVEQTSYVQLLNITSDFDDKCDVEKVASASCGDKILVSDGGNEHSRGADPMEDKENILIFCDYHYSSEKQENEVKDSKSETVVGIESNTADGFETVVDSRKIAIVIGGEKYALSGCDASLRDGDDNERSSKVQGFGVSSGDEAYFVSSDECNMTGVGFEATPGDGKLMGAIDTCCHSSEVREHSQNESVSILTSAIDTSRHSSKEFGRGQDENTYILTSAIETSRHSIEEFGHVQNENTCILTSAINTSCHSSEGFGRGQDENTNILATAIDTSCQPSVGEYPSILIGAIDVCCPSREGHEYSQDESVNILTSAIETSRHSIEEFGHVQDENTYILTSAVNTSCNSSEGFGWGRDERTNTLATAIDTSCQPTEDECTNILTGAIDTCCQSREVLDHIEDENVNVLASAIVTSRHSSEEFGRVQDENTNILTAAIDTCCHSGEGLDHNQDESVNILASAIDTSNHSREEFGHVQNENTYILTSAIDTSLHSREGFGRGQDENTNILAAAFNTSCQPCERPDHSQDESVAIDTSDHSKEVFGCGQDVSTSILTTAIDTSCYSREGHDHIEDENVNVLTSAFDTSCHSNEGHEHSQDGSVNILTSAIVISHHSSKEFGRSQDENTNILTGAINTSHHSSEGRDHDLDESVTILTGTGAIDTSRHSNEEFGHIQDKSTNILTDAIGTSCHSIEELYCGQNEIPVVSILTSVTHTNFHSIEGHDYGRDESFDILTSAVDTGHLSSEGCELDQTEGVLTVNGHLRDCEGFETSLMTSSQNGLDGGFESVSKGLNPVLKSTNGYDADDKVLENNSVESKENVLVVPNRCNMNGQHEDPFESNQLVVISSYRNRSNEEGELLDSLEELEGIDSDVDGRISSTFPFSSNDAMSREIDNQHALKDFHDQNETKEEINSMLQIDFEALLSSDDYTSMLGYQVDEHCSRKTSVISEDLSEVKSEIGIDDSHMAVAGYDIKNSAVINSDLLHSTDNSAVTIQSFFRMVLERKRYVTLIERLTFVQRSLRMLQERDKFGALTRAVRTIECRWMAVKAMRPLRLRHLISVGAAIVLQATFRGYLARRLYREKQRSAILIQSAFRRYVKRKLHRKENKCATLIQAVYRSYLARQFYRRQQKSAVVIQTVIRGHLARRIKRKKHDSAVLIQAAFRGHLAWKRHQTRQRSAALIQAAFREHLARKQHQMRQRSAALIQAAFRGYLARKWHQTRQRSAVLIQAAFRSYTTRRFYRRQQKSAILIQAAFRGHLARTLYQTRQSSAILIQAAYRSYKTRRFYRKQQKSATLIQAAFRKYLRKKVLDRQRKSAILIQASFRSYIAGKNYRKQQRSAVLIQASLRGFVARKLYRTKRQSAVLIQAAFRSYSAQKIFKTQQRSAIIVQAAVRGYLARKVYERRRRGAVRIQAVYRGYLARRLYREKQRSALVIQTAFRRYRNRKLVRRTRCATLIQAAFRGYRLWRQYRTLRSSAVVVQSAFRGRLARLLYGAMISRRDTERDFDTAVKIQSWFRMISARSFFVRKRAAAVNIQSNFRAYRCRRNFTKKKSAAVAIQRWFRACRDMRSARDDYLVRRIAAMKIQASYRRLKARSDFKVMICGFARLAALVKMHRAVEQYRKMRAAIVTVQQKYRHRMLGRADRMQYLALRSAVIGLQQKARQRFELNRLVRNRSAVAIQAAWRMYVVRKKFVIVRKSVLRLQSCSRGWLARLHYSRKREAILTIQRRLRAVFVGERTRKDYLLLRSACVTLQRSYRAYLRRRRVEESLAATKIQSAYRAYWQRVQYRTLRKSVILVQSTFRGWLVRQRCAAELRHRHLAAQKIYSFLRRCRQRTLLKERIQRRTEALSKLARFTKLHLSAIVIQRAYHRYHLSRLAQQNLASVVALQRAAKGYLARVRVCGFAEKMRILQSLARGWLLRRRLAAVTIQGCTRQWLARRREEKRTRAAVVLQAYWRGRMVRKATSAKVNQTRAKLKEASKRATEDQKLYCRMFYALDCLFKYKQLSRILEALMIFERLTSLSPVCCKQMIEGNAVNQIFLLIRSCNRSVPHMELIKYSVSVLLNLSKYNRTADAVYEAEGSVETLVELLQMYRDKNDSIFSNTCMLLGIMGHNPQQKEAIQKKTAVVAKLQSVQALLARKQQLEERQMMVKNRMSAARMGHSLLGASHVSKGLRIGPEWNLRRDTIHQIDDPYQAMLFMMGSLDIVPK